MASEKKNDCLDASGWWLKTEYLFPISEAEGQRLHTPWHHPRPKKLPRPSSGGRGGEAAPNKSLSGIKEKS